MFIGLGLGSKTLPDRWWVYQPVGGLQGVLKNPKTGVHQLAGAVFPKT
jgi:hypothetical protein